MTKIVLAIVIAVWLWPGLCAAGEAEWKASIDAGGAALQRSDYAEATSQFSAAVREAELFGAMDVRLGATLNLLAYSLVGQKQFAEAERLAKRALEINERVSGATHPSVGGALNVLAISYASQGRYNDAEPLFLRALSRFKKRRWVLKTLHSQ